jgi:predicted PurR-regulated permease PerM
MRRSIIVLTTAVVSIIVAIVFGSIAVTSVVYALNTHMAQVVDYTNTDNTKILTKKLNASIIIVAINAKVRSIYDNSDNN